MRKGGKIGSAGWALGAVLDRLSGGPGQDSRYCTVRRQALGLRLLGQTGIALIKRNRGREQQHGGRRMKVHAPVMCSR